MMNGKKLTSANPVIFETHSYNLSDLTEPAISFDFIGAAVNSFPKNYLVISYSKQCGIWKELAEISPENLASAGYYSQNFIPQDVIWNDTVMYDRIGSNDLKSENVRFKFEYFVGGLSNRLYIDNIRIGEADDLSLVSHPINKLALSVYPNPSNSSSNVIFETHQDGNISIKLLDILGSEVANLYNEDLNHGHHALDLDLSSIESGIYFISVIFDNKITETTKVIIQ